MYVLKDLVEQYALQMPDALITKDAMLMQEFVNPYAEEMMTVETEKFVKVWSALLAAEAILDVHLRKNVWAINVLTFARHRQLVVLTPNIKIVSLTNDVVRMEHVEILVSKIKPVESTLNVEYHDKRIFKRHRSYKSRNKIHYYYYTICCNTYRKYGENGRNNSHSYCEKSEETFPTPSHSETPETTIHEEKAIGSTTTEEFTTKSYFTGTFPKLETTMVDRSLTTPYSVEREEINKTITFSSVGLEENRTTMLFTPTTETTKYNTIKLSTYEHMTEIQTTEGLPFSTTSQMITEKEEKETTIFPGPVTTSSKFVENITTSVHTEQTGTGREFYTTPSSATEEEITLTSTVPETSTTQAEIKEYTTSQPITTETLFSTREVTTEVPTTKYFTTLQIPTKISTKLISTGYLTSGTEKDRHVLSTEPASEYFTELKTTSVTLLPTITQTKTERGLTTSKSGTTLPIKEEAKTTTMSSVYSEKTSLKQTETIPQEVETSTIFTSTEKIPTLFNMYTEEGMQSSKHSQYTEKSMNLVTMSTVPVRETEILFTTTQREKKSNAIRTPIVHHSKLASMGSAMIHVQFLTLVLNLKTVKFIIMNKSVLKEKNRKLYLVVNIALQELPAIQQQELVLKIWLQHQVH
ncbi:hypothetical protein BDFB_000141 [Asbolus verrucosus]|uniref:Uncharacterized protein n=1 Tax=Asbolus verrucosus TaxID=1661398 RepID=A0A482VTQ4_ASBVE|nr:hypothetical protein BDFB_000141 [Asbolus verrucosus]